MKKTIAAKMLQPDIEKLKTELILPKIENETSSPQKVQRVSEKPKYFYETEREMNGKFGWFSSYGKSYSLPEYFSGWEFESEELLNQFSNI